jgi:recombinational DNA repair ATPase RecF
MTQIQSITINGYKSIKSLVNFKLRPLNVLIGANGSGKNNFISAFRFLASVVGDNFRRRPRWALCPLVAFVASEPEIGAVRGGYPTGFQNGLLRTM